MRDSIELEDPVSIICDGISPRAKKIPLHEASGRVLTENIYAPLDQPTCGFPLLLAPLFPTTRRFACCFCDNFY